MKLTEKEALLNILEQMDAEEPAIPKRMAVLPLRDVIIFPNMIYPVLIGRTSSLKAVGDSLEKEKYIFLAAQKTATPEEVSFDDIYKYGSVARILQALRLPGDLLKVLVEGLFHAKIKKKIKNKDFLCADIELVKSAGKLDKDDKSLEATMRHAGALFSEYVRENQSLPPELISAFENFESPQQKLYYAAANLKASVATKQRILEKADLNDQFFELATILKAEIELLKLENDIDSKVQESLQKSQKQYFIREQIKLLQKELGDEEEGAEDIAVLKKKITDANLPEHAQKKADEELDKLRKMHSMSPEYSVGRTFLETLISIPWNERTVDSLDIERVRTILDEDHYNLKKPKERILEFIALLNITGNIRRQILCFVGPPGVGKTSLAKSIARALGRKFVRFSLGGVRDEAEIRGHRRTYIGSMPGKLIQSMKKAGTVNPVILLDEIDKMSMDFRGDPSAALLEALDPEQNSAFNDHYLEVDYDLSNVFFITTANVVYDIPLPLRDRMEIIELTSYLEPDKIEIAKRHIAPKLLKEYGLENFNIKIEDEALLKIIREHTRESGVRNLERKLGEALRKLAKELIENYAKGETAGGALKDDVSFVKRVKTKKIKLTAEKLGELLGPATRRERRNNNEDRVGVATGLAWTATGGDILFVEVSIMPGAEKLTLTGKLGDVMKESAQAALSFVRSEAVALGLPIDFAKGKEIHIHLPEGAIPKDGPSAGITLALALISAASGKPMRGDVAMTGEITLRGEILPIGGLKEKLLAASQNGIKKVMIPIDNVTDLTEIEEEIKNKLEIIPVSKLFEALPHAIVND
ncbi:MAG: endopeptidase La [Chloroflexota bacterium]